MSFYETHCPTHAHCKTCRMVNYGKHFRLSIVGFLEDNKERFECPEGRPWIEDVIKEIKPCSGCGKSVERLRKLVKQGQ